MKPSLQLKQGQHLALTPQLQQSVRMLQLSTLELNEEIEQALTDNPLLERIDEPLPISVGIASDGVLDARSPSSFGDESAGPAPSAGEHPSNDGEAGGAGSGEAGDQADGYDDGGGDWGAAAGTRTRSDNSDDERELPQLAASVDSLRDHLMLQLTSTRCGRHDRALVSLLIEELNDDGMLDTPLDEIVAALPAELAIEPEEVSGALKLLQSFDPTGVGARDLRECLLLQLDSGNPPGHSDRLRRIARAMVADHLDSLATRDYARLQRALRCDEDTLREAQALVIELNPRPASGFAGEAPAYLVPDVIVRRTREGWVAVLNDNILPKLRVNELYASVLRRNRGSHAEMSGQLQEARWLIKNVQQRFDTILRVSQAIVDRQKAFFSHGEVAMRPLVLREIADTLGLHESTISRVTTQKYMLTPLGTFELKYFFGSHVATSSGGAASSTAIRALIRQLVAAEDARRPLTDSQIADLLGEQGFVVARRTVAKYRDSLQIPAVSQRRAL